MACDQDQFDAHMMDIALRLADHRLGQAAPNPAVGAVIVNEATDEVLARAATAPGGRPHAETQAISIAGERAKGATIYVTLEPCAHQGKTGPCADAIIAAGLKRCVTAIEDPDPRVAGRGLDRLRAAGIQVRRGVGANDARWQNRGHIVRVTERRPFVNIKMALDGDGQIARGANGAPIWVTGPEARAHGHLLRATHDAILIGAGTARDDNPDLTCRLPGLDGRSPVRCVLDSGLTLAPDSRLAQSATLMPVIVFCSRAHVADPAFDARRVALETQGVNVVPVTVVAGQLWLAAVMEELVTRGITRLLVEGGPKVWAAFAAQSLLDQVALYMATGRAPDDQAVVNPQSTATARAALERYLGRNTSLTRHDVSTFGADQLWSFRKSWPTGG